jgi:hypothetical protein
VYWVGETESVDPVICGIYAVTYVVGIFSAEDALEMILLT